MCTYIKSYLVSGVLVHGGGVRCSKDNKIKGCQLTTYEIETGNYINRPLSDKSMKFCIMVDHDLTNDFNYDSKQNRLPKK